MNFRTFVPLALAITLMADESAASADIERAEQILGLVERACLSGERNSVGAELKISLSNIKDILTKGASGELVGDAFKETIRGGIGIVDERLKGAENSSIRECIKPFKDKLIEILLSATTDRLELSIDFSFQDSESKFHERNVISVGTRYPRWPSARNWARQSNNLFAEIIPMIPRRGPAYEAWVTRTTKTGVDSSYVTSARPTEICLVRAPTDPPYEPAAQLKCREGESCIYAPNDPYWTLFCDGTRRADTPPSDSPLPRLFGLIGSAHAKEPVERPYWSVPSLDILDKRRGNHDFIGTGYTAFRIVGRTPYDGPGDAYYVDLSINGRPVRIDGLPPEFLSRPISADKQIDIEFGLENLGFIGASGGCDRITAQIQFVANGDPVGAPLVLERSYVALRDADPATVEAGGMAFAWTGTYWHPEPFYDHKVFVQSIPVRMIDDREAIAKARHDMTRLLKRAQDTIQATFQDRAVTFVIRPPLQRPTESTRSQGYGLAAALVEPTGQIRFAFSKNDAIALRDRLVRLDASRYVIDPGSFVYGVGRENKDLMNPPGICNGL